MSNFKTMIFNLTEKKATTIPVVAQTKRSGKYSINIVCAKNNRKSFTVSKMLAEYLMLTSSVCVTAYVDNGFIVLSSEAIDEKSVDFSFSNENDRIVYNASFVTFLAETFCLDYENRTSHSFSDIVLDNINGTPVAYVCMNAKFSCASTVEPDIKQEGNNDSNV